MTDVNVSEAFITIAKAVKDRLEEEEREELNPSGSNISEGRGNGKKKSKKGKKSGENFDGKNAKRSKKSCC